MNATTAQLINAGMYLGILVLVGAGEYLKIIPQDLAIAVISGTLVHVGITAPGSFKQNGSKQELPN